MKKILFFIPAVIFTIFYGLIIIAIGFSAVSPLAYVWIALLIISGILLAKGKFWGGFFGMLPGLHLIYMSTKDTGQAINIELPAGIIVLIFYIACCGLMIYKQKKSVKA